MKKFGKLLGNNIYIILLIILAISISCQKNKNGNMELVLNETIIDEDNESNCLEENKFTPIIISPRTPGLPYDDSEFYENFPQKIRDLVYRGGGVGSMKFGEYFDLLTGDFVETENESTNWNTTRQGHGFAPEGPSSFSDPPLFREMDNLYKKLLERKL